MLTIVTNVIFSDIILYRPGKAAQNSQVDHIDHVDHVTGGRYVQNNAPTIATVSIAHPTGLNKAKNRDSCNYQNNNQGSNRHILTVMSFLRETMFSMYMIHLTILSTFPKCSYCQLFHCLSLMGQYIKRTWL